MSRICFLVSLFVWGLLGSNAVKAQPGGVITPEESYEEEQRVKEAERLQMEVAPLPFIPSAPVPIQYSVEETVELYKNTYKNKLERVPLDYAPVREADVMWQKRIWQSIPTNAYLNIHFSNPYTPLVDLLLEIAKEEEVQLFMDDRFTIPLTFEELEKNLGTRQTIVVTDPITFEEVEMTVENDFNWESITKYRIKEDWIFDAKHSRMSVRVLGIAPVRKMYNTEGVYLGEHPICWFYYPQIRTYLAQHETINPYSPVMPVPWDVVFDMRLFRSHIYKESNVKNERITDQYMGLDALIEAERVKHKIFEFEQYLWEK